MPSHLALLWLRIDMDIQNRLDLTDSYDFCDGNTLTYDLDGVVINMNQNNCIPQVHYNASLIWKYPDFIRNPKGA